MVSVVVVVGIDDVVVILVEVFRGVVVEGGAEDVSGGADDVVVNGCVVVRVDEGVDDGFTVTGMVVIGCVVLVVVEVEVGVVVAVVVVVVFVDDDVVVDVVDVDDVVGVVGVVVVVLMGIISLQKTSTSFV